jgi:hypothetical protein
MPMLNEEDNTKWQSLSKWEQTEVITAAIELHSYGYYHENDKTLPENSDHLINSICSNIIKMIQTSLDRGE